MTDASEERLTPGGFSRARDVDEDDRQRRRRRRRGTVVALVSAALVAAVVGGIALLGPRVTGSSAIEEDFPPGAGSAGFLAVIGGSTSAPEGREPELLLRDLADTPTTTSATITVKAANGRSTTMFTTTADRVPGARGLAFRGEEDLGAKAAALGPAPFSYSVTLVLDGTTYVGTGTWPDDEVTGSEPFVELDFDPPLPQR